MICFQGPDQINDEWFAELWRYQFPCNGNSTCGSRQSLNQSQVPFTWSWPSISRTYDGVFVYATALHNAISDICPEAFNKSPRQATILKRCLRGDIVLNYLKVRCSKNRCMAWHNLFVDMITLIQLEATKSHRIKANIATLWINRPLGLQHGRVKFVSIWWHVTFRNVIGLYTRVRMINISQAALQGLAVLIASAVVVIKHETTPTFTKVTILYQFIWHLAWVILFGRLPALPNLVRIRWAVETPRGGNIYGSSDFFSFYYSSTELQPIPVDQYIYI